MKSKAEVLKEFNKGRAEVDLLEQLATRERSLVATHLKISYHALTMRIETIRRHAIQYEWYTKRVNALKKQFPYIAGLLAPQKPTALEEEEFEL